MKKIKPETPDYVIRQCMDPSALSQTEVTEFEIMLQDGSDDLDSDVALTFNAGLLPHRPAAIFFHEGNLFIFSKEEGGNSSMPEPLRMIGWIKSLPDLLVYEINSKKGLLIVELSSIGIHSAQSFYSL